MRHTWRNKKHDEAQISQYLQLTYALLNDAADVIDTADGDLDDGSDAAAGGEVQTAPAPPADEHNRTSSSLFMQPTAKATAPPPLPQPSAACRDGSSGQISPLRRRVDALVDIVGAVLANSSREKGTKSKTKDRGVADGFDCIEISKEASSWTFDPEASRDAKRIKWPLAARHDDPFSDFRDYLTATKCLKHVSADMHVQKLQYFYGLIEFNGQQFSDIEFASGLYRSGLFADLIKLPILHPQLPTTRNVLSAVSHFCDWTSMECGRLGVRDAKRNIVQLKTELLAPLQKRVHKERTAARAKKNARDAECLENWPPTDVLQAGVKQSMVDLQTIWVTSQKADDIDWQTKHAINVIMAGIIYGNSYAGRPGEWQSMTSTKIEAFVNSGDEYLVIDDHKTVRQFGSLGRWVPPANVTAMKKVLDMHQHGSTLFLDPAKGGGKRLTMASVLKKWSSVYTPGHQAMQPTLVRKWFHTQAQEDPSKANAFQLLCDMDGHSTKTGKANYVVSKPKQQAQVGKKLFATFVGEPVQWPSDQEAASEFDRSVERIKSGFYKQSAEYPNDSSEEDTEDDDDESSDGAAAAATAEREEAEGVHGPAASGSASSTAVEHQRGAKRECVATEVCERGVASAAASTCDVQQPGGRRCIAWDPEAKTFSEIRPPPTLAKHAPATKKLKLSLDEVVHETLKPAASAAADASAAAASSAAAAAILQPPLLASASAASAFAPSQAARLATRPSPFADDQRNYIATECSKVQPFRKGKSPPNCILKNILEFGIASKKLPATATLEQVRSAARNYEPVAAMEVRCLRHSAV